MLDHVLVDLISAVRTAMDDALLTRQAVEERFQVDVFLGDVSWETSYSLPGEEEPARVRADLSFDWPTWSQTAYRSWSIGEMPSEQPEVVIEVALRIQRLAEAPPADKVAAVLAPATPAIGTEPLVRSGITIEEAHETRVEVAGDGGTREGESQTPVQWAVEATYEGSVRFDEDLMEHPEGLAPMVDRLASWIASTLVRLADLPFAFHPPERAS